MIIINLTRFSLKKEINILESITTFNYINPDSFNFLCIESLNFLESESASFSVNLDLDTISLNLFNISTFFFDSLLNFIANSSVILSKFDFEIFKTFEKPKGGIK